MRQDRLALAIEKLKAEQQRTLLKLATLRQELNSQVDLDELEDMVSDLTEHEMTLTWIRELENRLKVIDNALQRVVQGIYGMCERCGESIDPARLEIVPETTLCIRCKTVSEYPAKMRTQLPESNWSQAWRERKLGLG